MIDFCQTVSMSRPIGTLSSRVIPDPTLRNLSVSCIGLLKFSSFEAVEKSVRYSIRAIFLRANMYVCANFMREYCARVRRRYPKKWKMKECSPRNHYKLKSEKWKTLCNIQCTVNTSRGWGESYKLQVTCVCFWLLREL